MPNTRDFRAPDDRHAGVNARSRRRLGECWRSSGSVGDSITAARSKRPSWLRAPPCPPRRGSSGRPRHGRAACSPPADAIVRALRQHDALRTDRARSIRRTEHHRRDDPERSASGEQSLAVDVLGEVGARCQLALGTDRATRVLNRAGGPNVDVAERDRQPWPDRRPTVTCARAEVAIRITQRATGSSPRLGLSWRAHVGTVAGTITAAPSGGGRAGGRRVAPTSVASTSRSQLASPATRRPPTAAIRSTRSRRQRRVGHHPGTGWSPAPRTAGRAPGIRRLATTAHSRDRQPAGLAMSTICFTSATERSPTPRCDRRPELAAMRALYDASGHDVGVVGRRSRPCRVLDIPVAAHDLTERRRGRRVRRR